MRILILSDANSPHTQKWVQAFAERGIAVGLYSLRKPEDAIWKELLPNAVDVRWSSVGLKRGVMGKAVYLTAVPAIRKFIGQFRPDILHAHYASSYGLLGALSGFRPFVVSVWGSDVFAFPERAIVQARILRLVLARAQRVFSTSKIMAAAASRYCAGEIQVIPFGVDMKVFCSTVKRQPVPVKFAVAKALQPIYNVELVIRAFAKMASEGKHSDTELHIAGDGPLRQSLEQLSGEWRGRKIFFHGRISHSDMPRFLSDKHVLCNLSKFESFGVSVIEASAMEMAVIASRSGGLTEVVEHNKTGILLDEPDVEKVSQAMETFVNNPSMIPEMGRAGRIFVAAHYDFGENIRTQLDAYSEILQRCSTAK